jgi:hypothetical protein
MQIYIAVDMGLSCVTWYGPPWLYDRYATGNVAAVPVASDDDAVAAAGRQAASRTYGFLWTQLTEVAMFMFRRWVLLAYCRTVPYC